MMEATNEGAKMEIKGTQMRGKEIQFGSRLSMINGAQFGSDAFAFEEH